MIIIVVSIKDRLADCYSQPMYFATEALAVRSFHDAIADPQHNINKHPEDYELYRLATFDDYTGTFLNQDERPKLLAVGSNIPLLDRPADLTNMERN